MEYIILLPTFNLESRLIYFKTNLTLLVKKTDNQNVNLQCKIKRAIFSGNLYSFLFSMKDCYGPREYFQVNTCNHNVTS
jgi:hypothetical protein